MPEVMLFGTPGDDSTPSSELPALDFSKREVELLRLSSRQAAQDYTADVGYSPALFSQVSLPYKDPKDQEIWVRRNGDVRLQVTPRTTRNEATGRIERTYPFGIMPRLLVAYLTTEAKRTRSREVELGGSLTEFMRNLGMKHTGPNAKRLREHMRRFFGATITFEGKMSNAAGAGEKTVFFQFAAEMTLWDNTPLVTPDGVVTLRAPWESSVKLSEAFYNEIDNHPVPIDLNVLRALGSSPLRVDVYLWVAHRLSWTHEDSYISWDALSQQFGAQYGTLRQFKAAFLEAAAAVKAVNPYMKFDETKSCFVLKPSRTPIPRLPARLSKLKFNGEAAAE